MDDPNSWVCVSVCLLYMYNFIYKKDDNIGTRFSYEFSTSGIVVDQYFV